jgi:hypothetical protein
VTTQGLVLAVAVGAGAIALWLDVRFKEHSPQTAMRTFAHLAVSLLFLQLSPALVVLVVAAGDSPARKMVAVFAVLLPALSYVWLSSIWLIKLLQRSAHMR